MRGPLRTASPATLPGEPPKPAKRRVAEVRLPEPGEAPVARSSRRVPNGTRLTAYDDPLRGVAASGVLIHLLRNAAASDDDASYATAPLHRRAARVLDGDGLPALLVAGVVDLDDARRRVGVARRKSREQEEHRDQRHRKGQRHQTYSRYARINQAVPLHALATTLLVKLIHGDSQRKGRTLTTRLTRIQRYKRTG